MPRWPSAIVSLGARSPRRFRSRSTAAQLSVDSRCPLVTASTVFCPAASAPISTSSAALPVSSPAFTYTPSAHREISRQSDRQVAVLPRGVLRLPRRLQPHERARRARRALAQQPPQREFEIPEGEAVEVVLRQERGDLRRAALKERQQPTHKALLQIAHARPTHGDGAVHQRESARLAMAVAGTAWRVHRRPPPAPTTRSLRPPGAVG